MWPEPLRAWRFPGPLTLAASLRGKRLRVLWSVRRRPLGAGSLGRGASTRSRRPEGGRPSTASGVREPRPFDTHRVRPRAPHSPARQGARVHGPCRLSPAPATGRLGCQIRRRMSSSSVSGPRPWPVCTEDTRRRRTWSGEEHEGGKAGPVVIHGDAQFFDTVVDPSEFDAAQLRHLPHLPLHDFAEGVLRAVHVPFRDIPAEAVVPEPVGDAGRDRLALPAPLLGKDAVGDRAHRQVPATHRLDADRQYGGDRHDVLLREARILEGLVEAFRSETLETALPDVTKNLVGRGSMEPCEHAALSGGT